MKKLFKFSFVGAVAVFAAMSLLGLVLVIGAFKSLPNVEELVESYDPSVPTTIYDSNEKVVDLISREMREMVTMDEIPDYVKDAFVAIEDKRFYKHPGLDPIRLGKAVLVNLSQGRIAQGGSTITQQLAKNAFLSNEKKLMRKVKEVLIALEIEKKFSKDEILEKYINEIYFGSGFYGIQTASESIFGKQVSELNLPEAALLAGIPNRPSYYNPRKNLENAVKRSRLVLKQMKKQDLISQKEYEQAVKHKFIGEKEFTKNFKGDDFTSVIKEKSSRNYLKSPEFTDIIEKKLFELFDENTVYEGGLQVYTSLDLEMQKIALETFNEYQPFKNNPRLQGALITIDSSNGYVKSIVGGKNFKDGNFNRAIRAERQAGSAFKPFVYYTALEKGISMNAVREDSEAKFGKWEPQNYGKNFTGDVTLLEAMEKSINIIAIKLLKEIGIKEVIETVEKTGAHMDIPKDLTAALGTMTTSPYELATAYIPFSNGGYKINPVFITKILNREGHIIYETPVKMEKVFKSTDVSLLVHMMKGVVANGSGKTAKVKDRKGNPIEQGGKTGTTNDFRSAWYAGITPEYVTTLYVGYDDNSSMPAGSTGGSLAAPLWRKYYQKMIDKDVYKPGKFKFMENHISKGELVLVDIDSKTGFAGEPTMGSKRTGLFKRGDEPEKEPRGHLLRLKKFFGKDTEILDEDVKEIEAEIIDEDQEVTGEEEEDIDAGILAKDIKETDSKIIDEGDHS
ncbi:MULTISPECIES: transglycosylase domain-containing protein [Psychrilyobacter]|uniref:peptidoglycan glycosyltransferase n=1 Tax=Psychrilyobacter piezotolerans TaxID=2293438 RepID=A0ABX9KKF0_9FUSO|nr:MULTISPECIES: PBP1A family penicillin-binding protein [Psychrilyobacter]MCS5421844.1 PBP1A family penicillin-binding protein [Psychrilyobacter sp. S5]NDI76735.1 PBP1A family penicillin-binding protein [Psychrilyobacter piezotolerans]RDE65354.1 PBP1A family penicillin-binding protein [Psychrilyobacter sp. S5]REI42972.1 PBP1A family penicillin-binding protein [Psychrilyobacter piezotolerans]